MSTRSARRQKVRSELKNTAYEIFIGLLSILSIVNLVLVYAVASDPSLQQILTVMDVLFSIIFLADFTFRILTAPSAAGYFFRGFGWADLLASLPLPQFKILRLFRVLRVVRLLRRIGVRTVLRTLVHDRANSALMTLLLLGILVLEFGSLGMLAVEAHAPGANITSASDSLWYTMVTISTVGYGDKFPVTNPGRIVGTVIIVVGVGIFGTFTGYIANFFLGPRRASSGADAPSAAGTDGAPSGTAPAGDSAPEAAPEAAPPVAPAPGGRPADTDATTARLRELLDESTRTAEEMRRVLAGLGDRG